MSFSGQLVWEAQAYPRGRGRLDLASVSSTLRASPCPAKWQTRQDLACAVSWIPVVRCENSGIHLPGSNPTTRSYFLPFIVALLQFSASVSPSLNSEEFGPL